MYKKELDELSRSGLLRIITDRQSKAGPEITIKGKRLLNFSSNDYLSLSSEPEVIEAAKKAIEHHGMGAGASRLLSGGTTAHERLEQLLAEFKSTESALLFNSGYAANTGIIPAISDSDTYIFSDELNHASIIDGCRLSRAKVFIYKHCDTGHLKRLLRQSRSKKKIIVTDTVFSMDGDIAPLDELKELADSEGALLYIDDAHGTGVLGEGYGAMKHFGIEPTENIIQMGTLSKAIGAFGAFVASTKTLKQWLINNARSLIFSTALPSSVVVAAETSLRIIMNQPGRVEKLWNNRKFLVKGLRALAIDTTPSETPIIPIKVSDNEKAVGLSIFLRQRGIYAPAIRPPTVPSPRIRITVVSGHKEEHIQRLLDVLKEAKQCGLL